MAATEEPMQLLQLPDACLLAVLQCCADDLRSLFSAARAHSRLHQAAVLALSNFSVGRHLNQQRVDGVLLYLSKHGQHVHSMDLLGNRLMLASLQQLPPNLRLESLHLANFDLQLQPGGGFQGVVRPGMPLKQLRLDNCGLLDGEEGLSAAVALLTALQHLSLNIRELSQDFVLMLLGGFRLPGYVLSQLQQLTHLELANVQLQGPDQGGPALPLKELRLSWVRLAASSSGMLQHLTRLYLSSSYKLEPGAVAGLTQLQHLQLILHGSMENAQQLSQLQALQQLTHLRFFCMVHLTLPPAAAFTALTASSKLHHLDISDSSLPSAVLQHMFPAGRQLPHLHYLDISCDHVAAPEGTRLVSCCPGLQRLVVQDLQCSAELLAPLQGLSGLHALRLASDTQVEGVEAVCQLTGLQELVMHVPSSADRLLLQLTQLKQLTFLDFIRTVEGWTVERFPIKAPGDEPVWRQILRHHLDHSDPEVVQQAVAALAEQ